MFDFHSHILPMLDDGSQSIEESLAMLGESMEQGIAGMAATPHFYAEDSTPDRFVEKRRLAFEKLNAHLEIGMPQIKLGAEVHYYEGICRSDEVLKLRMEGTDLLLVEMPVMRWTSRMIHVLVELNSRGDITVLLAHIERYLPYQSHGTWEFLRQHGILMQANATFFLRRTTRRSALRMLKEGEIDLLGSDCHNMKDRGPCLGEAVDLIKQNLGKEVLDRIRRREEVLLNEPW